MAEPLVDVGIPAYRRSPYIEEAVECVLTQTLESWRLVISDDGPGDEELAAAVAPYLDDVRIEYRPTGERIGPARNHGAIFSAGSARYVAILDHDDRWEPEFLARRVDFLEANPDCAFVFSGNVELDGAGAEIGRSRTWLTEGVHAPEAFVPVLLRRNVIAMPTVVGRRSAYEEVGARFDESFRLLYDYELWLRAAVRFPVGYLHLWDTGYRRHDDQMTFTSRGWGEEWLHFLDHADALVPPRLRLPPAARRKHRANAFLIAALDDVESARRRRALGHLVSAVRANPRSIVDTRVLAALAGLALGRWSRRGLARARRIVHRRSIRVHLRPW